MFRCRSFFFFNDTATTEIYTLSLHDALPILLHQHYRVFGVCRVLSPLTSQANTVPQVERSEEHTSELQSPCNLVCRLLLEKKKYYDAYLALTFRFSINLALVTSFILSWLIWL